MLKFIASLTFLYAVVIGILLVYGAVYYRNFKRSRYKKHLFPVVVSMVSIACIGFLWINFHPPLRMKTFSNLDHYFLQHDGFQVNRQIELGNTDTTNYVNASFNRFVLAKENGEVVVKSVYSEDPIYLKRGDAYQVLSRTFSAVGHEFSYRNVNIDFQLAAFDNHDVELRIGDSVFKRNMHIKRGISCWNVFREADAFINSPYFHNPLLIDALSSVLLIRDDVTRKGGQELKYFLSGQVTSNSSVVKYDGKLITAKGLSFETKLEDGANIAWGIGFLENNRNQYQVKYLEAGKFLVAPSYPLSYPLATEDRAEWKERRVSKFLVSDQLDLQKMPSVFREGFFFPFFEAESNAGFSPVLLSYNKGPHGQLLDLQLSSIDAKQKESGDKAGQFHLMSQSSNYSWVFSIKNTYDWKFSSGTIGSSTWRLIIFGSLGLFFLLVLLSSLLSSTHARHWVWQMLSCITLVLLTTRFFLYWRYKTFPPYEGMDLPSRQQLESLSNFGVIVAATLVLAIAFGFPLLKKLYSLIVNRSVFRGANQTSNARDLINSRGKFVRFLYSSRFLKTKSAFFCGWSLLLLVCGSVVALKDFEAGISRHIAVVLMAGYFLFLHWAYRYSPLVASADESWWHIKTGSFFHIVFNNPAKLLLSVSLLALFVFIDIGFAIVFLNFLLFNEAFLCLNYGIAGLSAGSRKNARIFSVLGVFYFIVFVLNLVFAPYVFKFILEMPRMMYIVIYFLGSSLVAYMILRLFPNLVQSKKNWLRIATTLLLLISALVFFPKDKILEKASMTKYRIDVLTRPVDEAIMTAYEDGKTYEPVIRAAQNQWFINTFIEGDHNPAAQGVGFQLLPHAPQNKGAKYNAQATDLVTSRFMLAEHGSPSVLMYVVLLLLPVVMMASFYKLYPDFTNRANANYPIVTAGFALINYLLVTALLVVLAATGRYIFFGQDLPFASILSKQSIIFPAALLISVLLLFKHLPQEYYANRYKLVPGLVVFLLLGALLFFVKPVYNRNKSFTVANLASEMDTYLQLNLQPLMDHIDTAHVSKKLPLAKKDQLFTDSLKKIIVEHEGDEINPFFLHELKNYARSGLSRHLDQRQMLYLDIHTGSPRLAVNENFFRVDPPPHLQQMWTGNVYGDTSICNVSLWNAKDGKVHTARLNNFDKSNAVSINGIVALGFSQRNERGAANKLLLINKSSRLLSIEDAGGKTSLLPNESYQPRNPCRLLITDSSRQVEQVLTIEPDAFMKNYYVNGSRFYVYPMGEDLVWARNFAEAISSDYATSGERNRNAFISLDYDLMNSLVTKVKNTLLKDTSYKAGAEYALCIADSRGRIIAMTDYIKGFRRPDPNNKAAFNKILFGEQDYVSQSLLRKQIGNLNLLRMNPGPGSTFKPIVFAAIASQLDWNWDQFSAEGFSEKQQYYGGEKVPEYDFEKDNGTIRTVSDYLKYSDNYYHSNVLLLGSYPKQDPANILSRHFMKAKPGAGMHWPYFTYTGKQYWLNGFQNWPGYEKGQADFGLDSSFTSIGLLNNFGIYTHEINQGFERFNTPYDSMLFLEGYRKSGFILPEYGLFDQRGDRVNHKIPYDLFISCFRGHVKGSSQVMLPPVKMTEAFGKMVSQNRNYQLTLNPYATEPTFAAFDVDKGIPYSQYLGIMRDKVFTGMREALFSGTAARLGTMLKNGAPYFYYAKTGTTGDDQLKSKSKLLLLIISEKDITHPDFNFRKNKFYTVYFTSQNGPAKQNEELQAELIKLLQDSYVFGTDMNQ